MRKNIILLIAGYAFVYNAISAQNVQWASKVLDFSSQKYHKEFAARQILGKPNAMPQGGHSNCAWIPRNIGTKEYIKVGYRKPMKIQQIVIAENHNPGAIYAINLYDTQGKKYRVYKGRAQKVADSKRMLHVFFEKTPYRVKQVELLLGGVAFNSTFGIDAVGISDSKEAIEAKINIAEETTITSTSKPENLGANINSQYADMMPIISPDGKTIYTVRKKHPDNVGGDDIWVAIQDKKENWLPIKNIGDPLNNLSHNFVCGMTPDGNALLLGGAYTKKGKSYLGLSMSYRTKQGWSFPQTLDIKNFYNNNKYNEFCLSNNGKVILMTVERNDTYGDKDIYASFLQEDGSWSEPVNIGSTVNTAGTEISPFLAADGITLYFSSSGYSTYGMNDIFITTRLNKTWTKWSEPQNLGPGINTAGSDAYYTIPASGQYAYFISDKNTLGNSDVFKIKLPKSLRPDPVVLVSGKVYNAKTNEPLGVNIKYEILPEGTEAGIARSNPEDGSYKIVLPYGKKYGFMAEMEGFISVNENLDVTQIKEYTELEQDLFLVPIEVGATVRLNNIFFEFGKADLKEESFAELNRVTEFMNDNTTIEIEISGHTDNVGSDAANLKLSQDRADAVRQFLTFINDVDPSRVIAKGYGESKPVDTTDTDEGRQLNRRVEFTILKK